MQPSCYAFDNRLLLETIAAAEGRCKGIAMVPVDADERLLASLERGGIVGTRLNVAAFDRDFFARPEADAFVRRLAQRGWLIQIYAAAHDWERIAPVMAASGATVIVDHLGEPDLRRPLDDPGFQAILAFGRSGRAWLKLSAPYRLSQQATPYADLDPFVRAARAAFGIDRCIWGSDWPFLNARPTSYGEQRDWLERIVPDAAERQRILVDNPRALYGFDGAVSTAARRRADRTPRATRNQ